MVDMGGIRNQMCNMCDFCGMELMESKQCNNKRKIQSHLELNSRGIIFYCKSCKQNRDSEFFNQDSPSSVTVSLASSDVSLSSSDSLASSSSEFSVNVNPYLRTNQEECTTDSSKDDMLPRLSEHLQHTDIARNDVTSIAMEDKETIENEHLQNTDLVRNDISSPEIESNEVTIEGDLSCSAINVEIVSTDDGQDVSSNVGKCQHMYADEVEDGALENMNELDVQLWEPPEAEDLDDDMESSVANYDEDDEIGDGANWGKPSSLGRFGEGNYSFKDEKQRAMKGVMNGKFRTLVGQLIKSVGVELSGEQGESWIDIVTSLSWEAASFVKLDTSESKATGPDGYVKVKCIESGYRSQSQIIKGLVFKKHAAHKHMPTKYKNPRLLLIRGMLSQSSSMLSSFDLMEQEKNNLKSVIDMIEILHPNVVLAEKTVSRDVQEFVLKKGITLVFDMKLHRLERVARCTSSPIISFDTLISQKLKHCDDFHFEKFIEELALPGEAGKKPSKTLMFLEGCPTRLGCTILLKGSQSDELKKIKCVVQCAFVMAYHLILETSYLTDQRAMFSAVAGMGSVLASAHQSFCCLEESTTEEHDSSNTVDIPISGSENLKEVEEDSTLLCESYDPCLFSGSPSIQASLEKVIGDSFPPSSSSYQSLSSYFGLSRKEQVIQMSSAVPFLTFDHSDMDIKCNCDENMLTGNEKVLQSSMCCEDPLCTKKLDTCNEEEQMQSNDKIGHVLDSQSILVLMSSRNASRGSICEQIHFSHIKFYKNFDVTLGKFLRHSLLDQRHQCKICSEPPEAHFYYYAHHKKQLTIKVKRLVEKHLPGEAEEKLWMWGRCGKCKPASGSLKSTKRVLMSTATQGLSFGKFLKMSFLPGSSFKASSCGHSLDRDFRYFFGLGSMIAMFKYSSLATYIVSAPPQKLAFSNPSRIGLLDKEIEYVHEKGMSLFMEVENSLRSIGSKFGGSNLKFEGFNSFYDVEEILKRERFEFQVNIKNIESQNSNTAVYGFLSVNQLLWDILLESCVWDRRLHLLLSYDSALLDTGAIDKAIQGQDNLEDDSQEAESTLSSIDVLDNNTEVITRSESHLENGFDIPIHSSIQELGGQDGQFNISVEIQGCVTPWNSADSSSLEKPSFVSDSYSGAENSMGESIALSSYSLANTTYPVIKVLKESLSSSQRGTPLSLLLSNGENSKEYVWTPFPKIRQDCTKDLQREYLPKFYSICNHNPDLLPLAHQIISEEGSRLHIGLNVDDYMVIDFADELSSIIACAIASLRGTSVITKGVDLENKKVEGIPPINSVILPHLMDSDEAHLAQTVSLDSRFSSFDGFNLLNTLVSFGALHPEVSMGVGKLSGKGKYSVVCFYATEFRDLRNRCCPSELDYVASLSRCRNWDAKGGKSKSFFAKTMDGRFIIKEIKKTESESFMKFAQFYFEYMNHSFDSGSQTCLAKILGIYQVKLMKSGKEVKQDLMVMENLTFGRSVTRQYDLKGALHARFNSSSDSSGDDVLLDQNFVNDMNASPLYVSNKEKRLLQRAVWNDTAFLNTIQVMDYSLLVGVDSQRGELVCGIIDYLRQYTWDKQLETWVKSSLVVPKNVTPTVVSPVEYKKRFRKFMSTHLLSVPDHWSHQHKH